jgi:hypothetical protein
MSTSSFPFGDNSSSESEILHNVTEMSLDIEQAVLDVEPKARELNRHLVALLGRCPSQKDGAWVHLEHGDDGGVNFVFSPVSADFALVLVARLAEVSQVLDDNEPSFLSSRKYQSDLGPEIVGNSAALHSVPTTHIRTVR